MDLGPGVYIEEVTLPRSIDGVATSTAAFLGHATDGPLDRAVLVTSVRRLRADVRWVADLRAAHAAHPDDVPDVDHLWHAVLAFFANGGRRAYVRRMSTEARDALPLRDPAAFRAALDGIDADPDARESSVVATPGLAWDATGRPILEIIAGHCTRSRRRIALIDLPADAGGIAGGGPAIGALGLPSTSFAAAYHPWLVVANPLGDPPTVLAAAVRVHGRALRAHRPGAWGLEGARRPGRGPRRRDRRRRCP